MAGETRQFNVRGTSFTPAGGIATSITGVTSVDLDPQGSVQKFSGDGDRFPTTVVSDFIDNMVTIVAADLQAIRSLDPGVYGAMAFIHKDAKKRGASAEIGDMSYAITSPNAMVVNNPITATHRQFGQGRLIICTESSDGDTNPIASTVTTV